MNVVLLHVLIFVAMVAVSATLQALCIWRENSRYRIALPPRCDSEMRWANAIANWPGAFNVQVLKADQHTTDMFVGRSGLAKQLWRLTSERGIAQAAPIVFAVLATYQVAASAAGPVRTWSEFQNGGQLIVAHSLPTQWSPENSLAWQVDLIGYGQSTPVCSGDRVFVTTTRGENKEVFILAAYNLQNGTLDWQLEFTNPTPEKNDSYISRSAPTPIVDSDQVVALFEGGVLAAANHDGKLLWPQPWSLTANSTCSEGAVKHRLSI